MPIPKSNPNALKNGFYTRLYHASESGDLIDDQKASLDNEINLLRVMIRRTMELADGIDDMREATRVLDALGAATSRLANLLRAQKTLKESKSTMAEELSIAIREVNAELRRKDG